MSGTTGRVTQSLVEVADSGGDGEARTTQALAEVLYSDPTTGRVTQVLAEALYDFPTSSRLTQVLAEVLVLDSVGGKDVSSACLLWRLTLRDGTVKRFAGLDVDVVFGGETYLAAAPFDASASEMVRTLAAGQIEVAGLIDNDEITPSALINGLYDDAVVEVFRVDWSDPAGGAEALTTGRIGAVSAGPLRFEAEALTPSKLLDQQMIGTVTAGCRALLGDSRCGVNLASWTESHTVTSAASLRQFTASGFGQAAGWASGGTVEFTSGANAGAIRRIGGPLPGCAMMSAPSGADVVTEARRWIGTPWRHQARLHQVGVDCGGLIVCVAQGLGLPVQDHPAGYGRLPDGVALRAHIEGQCVRLTEAEPGAVVLMRWTLHPQHVGFVGTLPGGWSLIHAWAGVRRVVEHLMDDGWKGRIVRDDAGTCFYRLPGVVG